jgi:Rrf2 family protein
MINSHFDTTIKIMIQLAVKRDDELNSEALAKSLETNPAFIRKIMAKLSKANLIETRRGQNGGVSLLKNPKDISLKDIYMATSENGMSSTQKYKSGRGKCSVSCSAESILLNLSSKLEKAQLLILSRIKLSHLIKDIQNEKK